MSELTRFLPQDQERLCSVFYRLGVWMSAADDTDIGTRSEDIETARLDSVLVKIASDSGFSPLVREMAAESVRRASSRALWARTADSVLEDVAVILPVLGRQGTGADVAGFSRAAMLVATSVARAFREDPDNLPASEGYFAWLTDRAARVADSLSIGGSASDKNISPEEDQALHALYQVLRDDSSAL